MDEEGKDSYMQMFLDENVIEKYIFILKISFFRRPDWSPDGSFFLVPGAQYQNPVTKEMMFCAMGFTRGRMNQPSICLPVHKKAAILVRFCPLLFSREPGDKCIFDIPYHMVWALATLNKIQVYSTRSTKPMFIASNLHYASLSDLSWSGSEVLAISSMDGYISFAIFEPSTFGSLLPLSGECFI